jgi:hypothetical protein
VSDQIILKKNKIERLVSWGGVEDKLCRRRSRRQLAAAGGEDERADEALVDAAEPLFPSFLLTPRYLTDILSTETTEKRSEQLEVLSSDGTESASSAAAAASHSVGRRNEDSRANCSNRKRRSGTEQKNRREIRGLRER